MIKGREFAPWRGPYLTVIGEAMYQYEKCRCEMCRDQLAEAIADYDEVKSCR